LSQTPLIAIVDDDEAMREALSDLLEVAGFSARAFDGADAFLAEYGATPFDLLVTDIRMPGIDGIELQARLRALGSSLPVIFVTSASDAATQGRAQEGGAFAYLTKPISDEYLLSQIHAALGRNDELSRG
jgi:two-component system response regulator FixJ